MNAGESVAGFVAGYYLVGHFTVAGRIVGVCCGVGAESGNRSGCAEAVYLDACRSCILSGMVFCGKSP